MNTAKTIANKEEVVRRRAAGESRKSIAASLKMLTARVRQLERMDVEPELKIGDYVFIVRSQGGGLASLFYEIVVDVRKTWVTINKHRAWGWQEHQRRVDLHMTEQAAIDAFIEENQQEIRTKTIELARARDDLAGGLKLRTELEIAEQKKRATKSG